MEGLEIYKKSLELIRQIYEMCLRTNGLKKDFSLQDQLKRAAISVLANIAEGYGQSLKQNRRYLCISSGSANEVVALLQVVEAVHGTDTRGLQQRFRILGRQVNAFARSLK